MNMRKIVVFFVTAIVVASCKSSADRGSKPLYEVLTQQSDGGAQVRFFEILTEEREIKMLQNDENLKNKVKAADVDTANFVILNMGEKSSGGHAISIESVRETADKIYIKVKETSPAQGEMATSVMSYPYAIVKINSKKEIVIE